MVMNATVTPAAQPSLSARERASILLSANRLHIAPEDLHRDAECVLATHKPSAPSVVWSWLMPHFNDEPQFCSVCSEVWPCTFVLAAQQVRAQETWVI